MSDEPDSAAFHLGQLTGQVREMIHRVNNMAEKIELIGREVIKASDLPSDVRELKVAIANLEAKENQRSGAVKFGAWLVRSPMIGWMAAAALFAWSMTGFKQTH